ncbi:tRNA lysidine(34) synthetase TilS [Saccharobesus litoralis]|uniref:tRNA(Ile)-lysidine synthase n=1 Tax=Saccharobesus litoralis TaxID=2172099 RepID=A0A2S0VVB0_9ALTE|nr:tRNA lysidine(34) synthetase TilS [Saccharobesus litoralis]AWB68135.1 tRNA lysidine(34) synthetase TilS [Saccharobesus litoralis]
MPKLNTQVQYYLNQPCPIFIALSGGLDSSVLLHMAAMARQADQPLYAIHINHGLSKNAEQWQHHCQLMCERLNVTLLTAKASITTKTRTSLEAQAREARYQLMQQLIMQQTNSPALLLTGQHMDDQVETFFIRLKRGSGPKGLAAMRAERQLTSSIKLVRPLLHVRRQQLVQYAQSHHLTWVEDESNADNQFDRNFLRNQILPMLETRWSGFSQCVNRSAELAAEYNDLVTELAEELLQGAKCEALPCELGMADSLKVLLEQLPGHAIDKLSLNAFKELSPAKQRALLRCWLASHGVDAPSQQQMQLIQQQLFVQEANADTHIKLSQVQLRVYRHTLFLIANSQIAKVAALPEINLVLSTQDVKNKVFLQVVDGVSASFTINIVNSHEVKITNRLAGSVRCQPQGRQGSRQVKKLMHEYAIPPWQRSNICFVVQDKQVCGAVGVWQSHLDTRDTSHQQIEISYA